MCGILGQIKISKDIDSDRACFKRALDLMSNRGPDDWGILSGRHFIFGHRRLRILDLSTRAGQPMKSSDGAVTITFNGEIYNFAELRRLLESKGYRFRSSGDTEVLLNGFHCYGIDFVEKCNGMFAFGIHDGRTDTSYLVRDRLGLKPLYYIHTNGRLTFASEIKSILAIESLARRLNLSAVVSYIHYRYPILEDTFFKNVLSLPPGHYLKIHNGTFSLTKYWDQTDKFQERQVDRGEQYYIDELRRLLASALDYRLISDVPVGACLSGGLDSSIVTALMAEQSSYPVESYSIGYREDAFNEFPFAELLAARYRTHHHELSRNGSDYLSDMDKLIGYKDAPLSIPNEVPLYQMAEQMKKRVTVALSGNGSDEIFCGYGRIFRSVDDYEKLKALQAGTSRGSARDFLDSFQSRYKTTSFTSELSHFLSLYNYTPALGIGDILSASVPVNGTEERLEDRFRTLFAEVSTGDYLDKMVYAFVKVHLPGILLYQDMAFMAASMEVRVPFVDHRVVEFAFTIPHHYLLRWRSEEKKRRSRSMTSDEVSEKYDIPKYILRKAFESQIPQEILTRKKKGFPVPLHQWFGDTGSELLQDVLSSATTKNRGLYNTANLAKWLSGKRTGNDPARARRLWMLLNLELFMRKYFDHQTTSDALVDSHARATASCASSPRSCSRGP